MKFKDTRAPKVVPKSARAQPSLKTAMADDPRDTAIMERQRADAIRQATGRDAAIAHESTVNMAELMGNTAQVRPSAPLKQEIEARVASDLGPEWIRQLLPSKGVPYDFDEVFLRPLSTVALSKLSAAAKNKSYSMLIDALDSCVNVDIRLLTPDDFTFIMYWVRLNSYPSTPMSIPWRSKYGNENTITFAKSDLEIIELSLTKKDFEENWKSKGLCFPTLRDAEIQNTAEIHDDDRWRVEVAQYIAGDKPLDPKTYVQDKLEAFERHGVAITKEVKDFSGLIVHGVKETVRATDKDFTPQKAIAYWLEQANDLEKLIRSVLDTGDIDDNSEMSLLALGNRIVELRDQAAAMQKDLDEGKRIKAEEEVITITISVMDFFPYL